ncbi:hypothetical protein F4775DRAFT_565430 [Biscogniauxia sp. FL1348]|nr:hypothetical protein F4775DRAFT_565430 [Biscogniauxia sp. FL1348]
MPDFRVRMNRNFILPVSYNTLLSTSLVSKPRRSCTSSASRCGKLDVECPGYVLGYSRKNGCISSGIQSPVEIIPSPTGDSFIA